LKNKIIVFTLICAMFVSFCSCSKKIENNASSQITSSEVSSQITQREDALLQAVKEKYATYVHFFYTKDTEAAFVGYKPLYDFKKYGKLKAFYEISGSEKINEFKESLRLDEWEREEVKITELPKMVVYVGTNIHINLEMHINGRFYASINTPTDKAYFKIPQSVYYDIYSYCEK